MTSQEHYDAIVIGAGFNGLYQLYRLRQEGFSVRLLEAAPGLGGVWQNNRYPGARVDSHVPNYEYSLPEVWADWVWSERFPSRDELVRYFDHVARVLHLGPDIELNTRLRSAVYHHDQAEWHLRTDTGRRFRCSFLLACTGFGSKPYIPDLPGLDTFGGVAHHTAQWPATGVDWHNKKVAVIGTGASGVQVTQETASSLFGMTDSWYMAANIPGKRRQLLNYPNSDAYLQRLNQCAAHGYSGFEFS